MIKKLCPILHQIFKAEKTFNTMKHLNLYSQNITAKFAAVRCVWGYATVSVITPSRRRLFITRL